MKGYAIQIQELTVHAISDECLLFHPFYIIIIFLAIVLTLPILSHSYS